jgi:NADH-quinone oxidoreductase subunit H
MIDWIQTHIPPWAPIALVVHLVVLGTVAYLILLERKVASWVQDRIGPNRVGLGFGIIPWLKDKKMMGLGQPLADGMKFIFKEDYRPKHVDRILFTVAPMMMIVVIIISIAVIPWGGVKQSVRTIPLQQPVNFVKAPTTADLMALPAVQNGMPWWVGSDYVVKAELASAADGRQAVNVTYRWPFQIADLNIGVLFILATLSLAVYGVVVGGWASNNKYSFLGGLRATANMISYEIPLGLAVLSIVILFGTLDLGEIVDKQAHYWAGVIPAWNVFCHPLAFVLFLTCIHAEANRAPFDTAEAEQELVGGYHTEYSSMRFALFFLAEYAGMITTSALTVALFLGGWHLPWLEWLWPALRGDVNPAVEPSVTTSQLACVVRFAVFFGKTLGIVFVFMWTRWSLPRFRFDQILMLAWRALIPISLAMLMVTAVVVYLWRDSPRPDLRVTGTMAIALLVANVALTAAAMAMSLVIPPPPETNRKVRVADSRFVRTPLPKWEGQSRAVPTDAAESDVVHAGAR